MGALKPLLAAEGLFQFITDDVEVIGNRHYVKATVTVTDGEVSVSNSALAREDESKKGMDGSQVTGAASSYARKYALNGMWNIDDSKDADTNEFREQQARQATQSVKQQAKPQLVELSGQTLQAVVQWLSEGLAVDHVIQKLESKYSVTQQAAEKIKDLSEGK